jgi:hypothetical protein
VQLAVAVYQCAITTFPLGALPVLRPKREVCRAVCSSPERAKGRMGPADYTLRARTPSLSPSGEDRGATRDRQVPSSNRACAWSEGGGPPLLPQRKCERAKRW